MATENVEITTNARFQFGPINAMASAGLVNKPTTAPTSPPISSIGVMPMTIATNPIPESVAASDMPFAKMPNTAAHAKITPSATERPAHAIVRHTL